MNSPFTIRPDIRAYAKLSTRSGQLVAGQVELTSKCFQKCAMCESWRDDLSGVVRGTWTLARLQELCCELSDYPHFEHLALTGGDPQYWPHLTEFLCWFRDQKKRGDHSCGFDLQINTALTQDMTEEVQGIWREVVRDVRVSLDAATPRTYQLMRGDARDPVEIVDRMARLRHPRMATNTCVTTRNIHEVQAILKLLAENFTDRPLPGDGNLPPLRKAMFLAVIGDRDTGSEAFWGQYRELKQRCRATFLPTSFSEDVAAVRDFLQSEAAAGLKCYAGNSTFHVKANGDWYPCCLVGGEAIETHPEFRMGNYWTDPLWKILLNHKTEAHYGCDDKPCSKICQWKQLQLNLAASEADGTILAMP